MSCFIGSFRALPGVRCDRFDNIKGEGNTVAADQFFLSHCHTDHMVGMETLNIFLKSKSRGTRINHHLYCSVISKNFVLRKYKNFPANTIVTLIPNDPKLVTVYDSLNVYFLKVTALPSNHCPGSLMFKFERLEEKDGPVVKRILYTGDFRFDDPRVPLTALHSLHDSDSTPLTIDEMYLDTTFCSPQYLTFPSRQEAEDKIWELCQKWVRKNGMFKDTRSKHVILFHLSARYGYESIMQTVYQKSRAQWRVHVDGSNFADYLCSSSLAQCTDPDPKVAPWIHACKEGKRHHDRFKSHNEPLLKTLPCQSGDFEVCQIKPSAMYFTQKQMGKLEAAGHDRVVSVSQGGSNYRVCYSTHSSFLELERFVRHFSPLQITPCAIPSTNPPTTRDQVAAVLHSWLTDDITDKSSLSPPLSPPLPLSPARSPNAGATTFAACGPDKYDPDVMMSPSPPKACLKRKISSCDSSHSSHSSGGGPSSQPKLLKLEASDSSKKISFDDTMDIEGKVIQGEPDSSDEEGDDLQNRYRVEIIPSGHMPDARDGSQINLPNTTVCTKVDRRKMFARSKSGKACYSMPVPNETELTSIPKERRKSMPSNMKMPIIKVTPSSPSPDPNHPDYPEFFEDKLYLELTNGATSHKRSPSPPTDYKEVSLDNFTLVLEPDDDEEMMEEVIRLTPELSPLKIRRQSSMLRDSFDEAGPSDTPLKDNGISISLVKEDSGAKNTNEVKANSSYDASSPNNFKVSNRDDVNRIYIDVIDDSINLKQQKEDNIHKYSDSVEIIEPSQKSEEVFENKGEEDILNDTPEIEDLLFDAERNNMPAYVMKTLEQTQRRKDNVVLID